MDVIIQLQPSRPETTLTVTRGAARLLVDLGYAPLAEVTLPNGRRADLMALGPKGDVLIVEDIVDSGLTLSWIRANLESRSPASVEICTLLRKPDAAKVEVDVKWVGFDIPNEFVVGYGLDYAERYRDMPYIGRLKPSVYEH